MQNALRKPRRSFYDAVEPDVGSLACGFRPVQCDAASKLSNKLINHGEDHLEHIRLHERIKGICEGGHIDQAMYLLDDIVDVHIDTYALLLQACAKMGSSARGRMIHTHIIVNAQKLNVFHANTLMNMYIKCSILEDARHVFDGMHDRNVFTWTLMMAGYSESGQNNEAVVLFGEMLEGHVKPDMIAFLSALKVCSSLALPIFGELIHAALIEDGHPLDLVLGTALLDVYTKGGSLDDALSVFDRLPEHDVASWDVMIAAFAQQADALVAFKLCLQRQLEGVLSDEMAYVNILKICTQMQALEHGKQIHTVVVLEFEHASFIQTGLIDFYAKCGCVNEAKKVFDRMKEQDAVTWGVLISNCTQDIAGLHAFSQMQLCSIMPDSVTLVAVLKTCATLLALRQGKYIHACIASTGFEHDTFVTSILMDLYAKCACMEMAHLIFSDSAQNDVVCWNVMISGYGEQGNFDMSIQFFWEMQLRCVIPNEITYTILLPVCPSLRIIKQLHTMVPNDMLQSDLRVGTTLITVYIKLGSLYESEKIFNSLSHGDIILWNSTISAYLEEGQNEDAFRLSLSMLKEGIKPDHMTSLLILKVCCNLGYVQEGMLFYLHAVEIGVDSDVSVCSSLVELYVRVGRFDDAKHILYSMHDHFVAAWNALMVGYVQYGQDERVCELFWELERQDKKPNEITYMCVLKSCMQLDLLRIIHSHLMANGYEWFDIVSSTLVDMYSKSGSIEDAQQVFETALDRRVVVFNTMIAGYARYGLHEEAEAAMVQLKQEGITPNVITYVNVLNSCSSMVLLEQGKQIHCYILESEPVIDAPLGNTLVNMYFKCGKAVDAFQAFTKMPLKDRVSWSVLIEGFAELGLGKEALEVIDQMQKRSLEPDHIALIGVLMACSHAGLVDEGCALFGSMLLTYKVEPTYEHYTCVIDILGRAGRLEKAEELINHMAIEADLMMWNALLGACQIHCNMEIAKHAVEHILKLEPDNTSVFVILSNLSAVTSSCVDSEECYVSLFGLEGYPSLFA